MPRRDAARNRELLLSSAEEVFHEHGASAPLDLVVQRAGVGRATLYRHFPDRQALVSALFEARVDDLEKLAGATGPHQLETLLSEMWTMQQSAPGLFLVLFASDPGQQDLAALGERMERIVASSVEGAHQEGWLHPDVTAHTIMQVLMMLTGSAAIAGGPQRDLPGTSVLDVILRGLRNDTPSGH
ncbi:MAG: TetR/AcrR family transcriptional regulator [Nocardioides sp.]|uniref:TetR/AcrR family transcriptional regulator n=1 Tax=Nocardioides sp. TaxID=35761 RepID=UPI003EFEC282